MSKSKEQILTELYETHFVENYTHKLASNADMEMFDDIVGEIYVIICELPAKLITQIYNGCGINCFRRYVSGIINKQIRSNNSRVYRVYKRHMFKTIAASNLPDFDWLWEENANKAR